MTVGRRSESDDDDVVRASADDDGDRGADRVFGAVPLSQDAALLSQRPPDASARRSVQARALVLRHVALPVQLTGFNTSEVAAAPARGDRGDATRSPPRARAGRRELSPRRAPVPAMHLAGSARAVELFKAAEWLRRRRRRTSSGDGDVLQFIGDGLPQLNPQLQNELNSDIADWRARARFAGGLREAVPHGARAIGPMGLKRISRRDADSKLGRRRRRTPERPRDEPAVRIIAVFWARHGPLRRSSVAPAPAPADRPASRCARLTPLSFPRRRAVRSTVKDHQGVRRGGVGRRVAFLAREREFAIKKAVKTLSS